MHRHGHGAHHTAAASRVLVVDNGAGNIKLGFAGDEEPQLQLPNCVAKAKGERNVLVGPALLEARDISGLTLKRPYDRGFLVNWELERDIWSTAFKALAAAITSSSGSAAKGPGLAGSSSGAGLDYSSMGLALTEPLFNFPTVQALTEEVVFEEFGFASLYAAPGAWYTMNAPPVALFPGDAGDTTPGSLPTNCAATQAALAAGAGLVVDAGFSSVSVSPFFQGQLLEGGVQRLNLGGKALTNLLKETVSYRSLNMADEGVLMERVKEELCWVSQDALVDLKRSQAGVRSPHRREYVLPDGVHNLRGYVRPAAGPTAAAVAAAREAGHPLGPWPECPEQQAATEAAKAAAAAAAGGEGGEGGAKGRKGQQVVDQVLVLNNELFMVPEALFRPSDIGLQQQGVPELVAAVLASVHPALAPLLAGRVVVTGGCGRLPGFAPRLARETRALVPQEYDLQVVAPQDPAVAAWTAASAWAVQPGRYAAAATTRQQYFEAGGSAARRGRAD